VERPDPELKDELKSHTERCPALAFPLESRPAITPPLRPPENSHVASVPSHSNTRPAQPKAAIRIPSSAGPTHPMVSVPSFMIASRLLAPLRVGGATLRGARRGAGLGRDSVDFAPPIGKNQFSVDSLGREWHTCSKRGLTLGARPGMLGSIMAQRIRGGNRGRRR